MLIDTHCHLASHRFANEEVPELISRAQAAGVGHMVTLSTSLEDLPKHLEIARHSSVSACIGIHPCDVHLAPDDAVQQLQAWTSDPRVCALGETGLDYFHPAPEGVDEMWMRQRQRDFLTQHFELAKESGLNLVIHTRDAEGSDSFEDALSIYHNYHQHVRAVFHCFIGTPQMAKRVHELGGIVSFGGVATFKSAAAIRDTLMSCPAGSFMLETDSPYLAPEPHRGKRNEPAFVHHVAERLAAHRQESYEQLTQHTAETAHAFFRFRN